MLKYITLFKGFVGGVNLADVVRAAWNEQCIGDTLWASIWCRQAQHVRDIHAEVVDHLASYFVSAYSTVYFFSTNSSAFWRN